MSDVIIIGGGAAGMMAAYGAALCGHKVLLLERNEKLGKKLYITGKGRCNLTNASDLDTLFASFVRNSKFLYSSIYAFDNQAVMQLMEDYGLKLKTERGNRVFPQSDHSSDVIKTFHKILKNYQVEICYNTKVTKLLISNQQVTGVEALCNGKKKVWNAHSVILAAGGCSYPVTGSDGQAYELAAQAGHTVLEPKPSLVPLEVKEAYIKEMQGLSLKNVSVVLKKGKRELFQGFGEMLFTHFGVSGPLILSASAVANDAIYHGETQLLIDLKPALTKEQLDKRICRDFQENPNRAFKNVIGKLLPAKMISVIIELSGIDPDRQVNSITKEERLSLAELLKAFPCTITKTRGFQEAVITRGGVSVKEVNPSTMESKIVKNLHFAGEILDVDALTGGFNLQIAWSTGYLAGISISDVQRLGIEYCQQS